VRLGHLKNVSLRKEIRERAQLGGKSRAIGLIKSGGKVRNGCELNDRSISAGGTTLGCGKENV